MAVPLSLMAVLCGLMFVLNLKAMRRGITEVLEASSARRGQLK
jgi:hypothetical protein